MATDILSQQSKDDHTFDEMSEVFYKNQQISKLDDELFYDTAKMIAEYVNSEISKQSLGEPLSQEEIITPTLEILKRNFGYLFNPAFSISFDIITEEDTLADGIPKIYHPNVEIVGILIEVFYEFDFIDYKPPTAKDPAFKKIENQIRKTFLDVYTTIF